MTDYVVVLTEKYDLLHLQLLDARQLIDKNHIVIERDKVEKVTVWRWLVKNKRLVDGRKLLISTDRLKG